MTVKQPTFFGEALSTFKPDFDGITYLSKNIEENRSSTPLQKRSAAVVCKPESHPKGALRKQSAEEQ